MQNLPSLYCFFVLICRIKRAVFVTRGNKLFVTFNVPRNIMAVNSTKQCICILYHMPTLNATLLKSSTIWYTCQFKNLNRTFYHRIYKCILTFCKAISYFKRFVLFSISPNEQLSDRNPTYNKCFWNRRNTMITCIVKPAENISDCFKYKY